MLDPDLTNVLKRRIVASLIDVGITAFVTLGVWRSQLIAFPISSRDMITDLPIWSAEQQARRDAIAESLNTSFTRGNTEYAIDQTGLVLTALCAIVMFLLVFVLLPANTGWSPGKKLLGLGVVDDEGNNPSIPAHLIRSAVGVVDVLPVVIPGLAGWMLARSDDFHRRLGDRVAGTYVIDSNVGARFIDASVYERRNELRRAATATHDPVADDEMVQIGARLGGSQSGLHRDDPDPADAAADHTPDSAIDEHDSTNGVPVDHEVFDPPQLGAAMLHDLPAPAADDHADLMPLPPIGDGTDTLPPLPTPGAHGAIEHAMDSGSLDSGSLESGSLDAAQPETVRLENDQLDSSASEPRRSEISDMDLSLRGSASPASAPAPSHRSPGDVPHLDARNLDDVAAPSAPDGQPASAASANSTHRDNDSWFAAAQGTTAPSPVSAADPSATLHTSAPKPTHRGASQPEPEWEQPTPEPAPVWEPNGSTASFGSTGDTTHADTDALLSGSSPIDGSSHAAESGSGSPSSEAPAEGLVWNDQWQAWLFWDAEHQHWLRHDIDRDRWVPIS